jgi:hypothetical protein
MYVVCDKKASLVGIFCECERQVMDAVKSILLVCDNKGLVCFWSYAVHQEESVKRYQGLDQRFWLCEVD